MKIQTAVILLLGAVLAGGSKAASFVTDGNALRKAVPGMIKSTPVLFCGELDGAVSCYTLEGKKLWRNPSQSPAVQFSSTMLKTVQAGANQMPVVVKGAAWSAIRLDKKHVRLILIDPGYLDPQERQVEIRFQHRQPVNVTDILTKETFSAEGGRLGLSVPAGSMRFIDLTYSY
ncbi:hypothetical protein [Pontiella agarivorans]|uniref:Lambda-carrageenase C-terminal domain-containing protein n=1 Tax=Pontiella agarivorans TaxID=3038953 RepID=A0ABU5MSE1_9BACT|nr:hypothetical protein [Pontiella agarivorans]MDZ8117047.1 hypothetical protein [Pontiella agarivorans]